MLASNSAIVNSPDSLSRTETGGHVYRGSAGEDRQRAWEESFQSDPVIQQ
jgi:hypothetical protein